MTEALEAAKRARDSGRDVQMVRQMLKEARVAFEAADYMRAWERADRALELAGAAPGFAMPPPPSKFCPTCGSRYPSTYNVCPMDGSPLKPIQ